MTATGIKLSGESLRFLTETIRGSQNLPTDEFMGVWQKLVDIFNIAQERGDVSPPVLCVLVQTHRGLIPHLRYAYFILTHPVYGGSSMGNLISKTLF